MAPGAHSRQKGGQLSWMAPSKGNQAFYMAQKGLAPNEPTDILPVAFPMARVFVGFPGVAPYPIDEGGRAVQRWPPRVGKVVYAFCGQGPR